MKLMTFLAQIFVGCELTTKSAAGPWDFEQWRKCWPGVQDGDVEAQCIAAGPLALDACEEGLRQLSTGFPQYWGHVSVVEDQLRSERWETLRGRVESMAQKSQLPGSWDPNRSWAARDPVLGFWTGGATCLGGSRTWTSRACNRPPPALALHCSRSWKEDRRDPCRAMAWWATARRKQGRWLEEVQAPGPFVKARNRARTGKRPDGRFFGDGNGKQMCFSWRRSEGTIAPLPIDRRTGVTVSHQWQRRRQGRRQEVTRRVWRVGDDVTSPRSLLGGRATSDPVLCSKKETEVVRVQRHRAQSWLYQATVRLTHLPGDLAGPPRGFAPSQACEGPRQRRQFCVQSVVVTMPVTGRVDE